MLSENQQKYGSEKITEISKKWDVDVKTAAKIILDVSEIKLFWEWPNAEEFLYKTLNI
jgi:hypothetical protein